MNELIDSLLGRVVKKHFFGFFQCAAAGVRRIWGPTDSVDPTEGFTVAEGRGAGEVIGIVPDDEWGSVVVDRDAAIKLLTAHLGLKTQFSIIAKSCIRYEGFLKFVDPETAQASLISGKQNERFSSFF